MSSKSWDVVRDFYITNFGVTSELVDLVASSDILLMSVSGASNESISRTLGVDIESVEGILDLVLDFSGWKHDLQYNPYSVYNNMLNMGYNDYKTFCEEFKFLDGNTDFNTLYRICGIYKQIEDRIDREWN